MKEYKVAIIGCGVAGMTAAMYVKRAGLTCVLLEGKVPGGQVIDNGSIENYPGFDTITGSELALRIMKQLKQLEIDILYDSITNIEISGEEKIITGTKEKIKAQYVILATGRSPRKLGLENEASLLGRGLSYCAICDGTIYKNKEVIVIGGGDSAMEAVRYLSHLASKITLVHRRAEYRAKSYLQEDVKSLPNVTRETGEVMALNTKEKTFSSLLLTTGKEIEASAIFVYIGQVPNTTFLEKVVALDEQGYIIVDKNYQTNIDGIYAIGDCIPKTAYQIVTAMADAATCALTIAGRN